MHIPDGFVSGEINAATFALTGVMATFAVRKANRDLGERQAPFLGVTAAFVFAAQMINFPVGGGTSGHFLGAMLSSVLLGPVNAFLIMTVVLAIQCFGFADGGLTALGTNVFNMGFISAFLCYYAFLLFRTVFPKNKGGFLAAVAIGSWISVVVGATVCALELGFSGTVPLHVVLPAMAGIHAVTGIGEALITSAVVSLVMGVRPDLVHGLPLKMRPDLENSEKQGDAS